MMPQGRKLESRSCSHDKTLEFEPPKHEKEAIYAVNQRILNVCRIAGAALQRSNS